MSGPVPPPPPHYPYGAVPPNPPFPPHPYGQGGPPGPPRRRRTLPVVLAVVAAVLVVGLAVLVPVLLTRGGEEEDRPAERAEAPDTSTLDAVQTFDGLSYRHVPDGTEVDYPQSPPAGGDHAQAWLECGAYDEPVPLENLVHSLEHGTVWITYRDDQVDGDDVALLADQLPDNGILSPYPDQAAPVVITVWGRQLELVGAEDPRIELFVAEYGAGDTAPEPMASCHGGVLPDEVGGGDGQVV